MICSTACHGSDRKHFDSNQLQPPKLSPKVHLLIFEVLPFDPAVVAQRPPASRQAVPFEDLRSTWGPNNGRNCCWNQKRPDGYCDPKISKNFLQSQKNSAFKTAWSLRKNESKAPPGDDPFGEGIVLNLLEVIFWVYPKVLLNR